MYTRTKIKRVSYTLDDEARARIIGWNATTLSHDVSSGSEHTATSSSLSELFYGFGLGDTSPKSGESDSERDVFPVYDTESVFRNVDLIEAIVGDRTEEFKNVLRSHVLKALQVFPMVESDNPVVMRRNVMAYLRNCGYNAAICKTKWENSGGLTAGSYEFIDVIRNGSATRYFIDLEFAAEFEIARPTDSYVRLLQCLPRVFVGGSEDLKQILKAMSDAARRSMRSGGLHLPPWRKHRFMENKWLGPYRRTSNVFKTSFCSQSSLKRSYPAKRCSVGFNATVDGARLLWPSTARTR